MPAPTINWTTVAVSGRYVGTDGQPLAGKVQFFPTPTRMVDLTALTTVLGRVIEVALDEQGEFAVDLPATDDSSIVPEDWTYEVAEVLPGGSIYHIVVPVAEAATGIDLAEVAPVGPSPGTGGIGGGGGGEVTQVEFDALEGRIDTAESDVNGLQATSTSHGTRLTTAETNVTSLQATTTSLDTRTDALEASDTSLDARLDVVETATDGLDGRVETLEATDTSHGSRLTAVEASATSLDTRVDTAESDIDAVQATATSHGTRLTAVEASATSLDGRLDTAETDINALEASATSLDGRVDTLEAASDVGTDADVAGYVTNGTSSTRTALNAAFADKNTEPTSGGRAVGAGELVVNVKDHGAVGNGIADDTTAITAAVAAASAGVGRLFFPPGTYLATTLTVGDVALMGYGQATLKKTGSSLGFITLNSNTMLGGLTIDGSLLAADTILTPGTNATDIDIADCLVKNTLIVAPGNRIGLLIGSGHERVRIRRTRFEDCFNALKIMDDAVDVTLDDVRISNWIQRGVWVLGSATLAASDLTFQHVRITDLRYDTAGTIRQPFAVQGEETALHRRFWLEDVRAIGNGFAHEQLYEPPTPGPEKFPGTSGCISLHGIDTFWLLNCEAEEGGEDGFTVTNGCRNGHIIDNTAYRCDGPGYHIRHTGGYTARGNQTIDCGLDRTGTKTGTGPDSGIHAFECTESVFSGNITRDSLGNLLYGIAVTDCVDCTFDGSNRGYGVGDAEVWVDPTSTNSGLEFGRVQKIAKAADTTRNNTAAQTADPDLQLPVDKHGIYEFEAVIGYQATSTADFAMSWEAPGAGSSGTWTPDGPNTNSSSATATNVQRGFTQALTTAPALGGVGGNVTAKPHGRFQVGDAGGLFKLRWAQNNAEASDAIVRAGSFIRLTRVG